ncbi:universal stress protein UspA [Desulforamulus profundi]|uniref:Universal stress protein UspA n=1 Tax=Desulforamulus profundi TaxID=1383067 RepID=A0A2C6MC48_9FIRM|nr:universal stress protein [Desulforamulus profundi]MCL5779567.1 universal stress protein [Bacillota bacterium]PHJ36776.1 universal stress protein UspA [Desulforamulus profundi]
MKVLLASDGSKNSLHAGDYIVKLARLGIQLQVTVMSVVPFTQDMATFLGVNRDEYYRLAEMRTRPIFSKYEEMFNLIDTIQVDYVTEQGQIAERIVKKAESGNYDQIVLGARGLSNIKELVLGSVSHKVVQLAKCPVVIVK